MWNRAYRQKLLVMLESKRQAGYGLEAMKRLAAGRSVIYKDGDTIVEEFPDVELQQIGLDASPTSKNQS